MFICSIREEEAIQLDGLNAAQIKELREKSEKHAFQAEVNRMMKLIINSLYKNKEVSSEHISGSRGSWSTLQRDLDKITVHGDMT